MAKIERERRAEKLRKIERKILNRDKSEKIET